MTARMKTVREGFLTGLEVRGLRRRYSVETNVPHFNQTRFRLVFGCESANQPRRTPIPDAGEPTVHSAVFPDDEPAFAAAPVCDVRNLATAFGLRDDKQKPLTHCSEQDNA